jgi:hypothetical protein
MRARWPFPGAGADSAALTVSDGLLRAIDVGKNIAIPGAVDLVATIAGLVDHLIVENAAMTVQDPTRLTGTLKNPKRPAVELTFRSNLHAGMRITVGGAGPAGSTLVSDVVQVVDATTIILADATSAAVNNVEVILNDPDRVALSNYARRDVSDLTVDLGDRSVDDATVRIGGRGLESATARFSSLDLDKEVTIQAAGLFVTTIQSVDSPTQATLTAPAQRAVENVQADVWKTDSRPGLELLLEALPSLHVESAEIVFGPGVYDFTRVPNLPGSVNAAIGLRDVSNLTLRGAGAGATILRLMPNQDLSKPDTHVIETVDCRNLTLRDLSVHGAYLTMGNTNEQVHGITINQGSEDIVVEHVRVFQSAGDGIRLLGRPEDTEHGIPANKVRRIWVEGCRIIQNKRTGVAFQRAVELVWVRNCHIEMSPPSSDACLDFEPSGNSAPTDIIIQSNIMVHDTPAIAVSISGISGPDRTRRVNFTDNILLGGQLFSTDVDQLTIQDNMVLVPAGARAGNRIPLHIQRGGDSVLITGNLLVDENAETEAVLVVSEVNQRPVDRAIIANNLCFARSGTGIRVSSSEDVAVEGNLVVATGSCAVEIVLQSTPTSLERVAARGNDITVEGPGSWDTGILLNARAESPAQDVSVVDNSVHGAVEGVRFHGSGFQQTPVCALNRVDATVPSPLVGLDQLPAKAVLVGGAASRGGVAPGTGAGRFLVGLGDPNQNNVVGNVGDIYQRVDTTPGPRLFVKNRTTSPVPAGHPSRPGPRTCSTSVAARPCTRSHRAADGQQPAEVGTDTTVIEA